ncbi:MAG: hypothetical protein WDN06_20865 [Asticcacaulis sp.]
MSADLDRRQERTRQAIADAFAELLIERDYAEVTVAAVARTRQCRPLDLTNEHFKTRTDLLRHAVKPLFAVIATAVEPEGASPALIAILHYFHDNPAGREWPPPTRRAMFC